MFVHPESRIQGSKRHRIPDVWDTTLDPDRLKPILQIGSGWICIFLPDPDTQLKPTDPDSTCLTKKSALYLCLLIHTFTVVQFVCWLQTYITQKSLKRRQMVLASNKKVGYHSESGRCWSTTQDTTRFTPYEKKEKPLYYQNTIEWRNITVPNLYNYNYLADQHWYRMH